MASTLWTSAESDSAHRFQAVVGDPDFMAGHGEDGCHRVCGILVVVDNQDSAPPSDGDGLAVTRVLGLVKIREDW
jgi:hypothetical protein